MNRHEAETILLAATPPDVEELCGLLLRATIAAIKDDTCPFSGKSLARLHEMVREGLPEAELFNQPGARDCWLSSSSWGIQEITRRAVSHEMLPRYPEILVEAESAGIRKWIGAYINDLAYILGVEEGLRIRDRAHEESRRNAQRIPMVASTATNVTVDVPPRGLRPRVALPANLYRDAVIAARSVAALHCLRWNDAMQRSFRRFVEEEYGVGELGAAVNPRLLAGLAMTSVLVDYEQVDGRLREEEYMPAVVERVNQILEMGLGVPNPNADFRQYLQRATIDQILNYRSCGGPCEHCAGCDDYRVQWATACAEFEADERRRVPNVAQASEGT